MNQISNPKFYPTISWLDFSAACVSWNVIDKNLSSQDIDRTFIATNFEEVDLDNNDDNSLCRYEFLEITARLGKIKYTEKGICDTVAEGTRRIIEEFMIPNTCERMPWQEWREERLWNLEIDDLYKANKKGMDALYKFTKTGPHSKDFGALTMTDVCKMLNLAGYVGVETEKIASCAYSLSKMTIVDDMEDFDDYNHLKKVEFYEFLGRVAELMQPGEERPLISKLENLLAVLLQKLVGTKLVFRAAESDLETDSDNDDDVVEQLQEEIIDEIEHPEKFIEKKTSKAKAAPGSQKAK